jgi:hypothetical protein
VYTRDFHFDFQSKISSLYLKSSHRLHEIGAKSAANCLIMSDNAEFILFANSMVHGPS